VNIMVYTLGEAAKATGKSKAAISRAIKTHKLSAQRQEDGSFKIDPAELHRVYPPVAAEQDNQRSPTVASATVVNPDATGEIRELRAKLDAATERLAEKEALIAELRDDRNQWRTQAQTLLLTDQRAGESPKRRSWWRFGNR
jgi:hypothetical protein